MRWSVLPLVALVVLLSAAEAVAQPVPFPPGAKLPRPWAAPPSVRSTTPLGVPALAGASPSADLNPCDEVPGGLCGRVFVPLDRDRPGGAKIGIFFAVVPHTDDTAPAERTIFMTEGGPGLSATQVDGEQGVDFVFGPLRDRRDVVLIDYRGTGLSQAIDCEPRQQGGGDPYDAVRRCGEQLGQRSDLYGSADVAEDIEAVRDALGVERFDFYGFSYAGADAQAYAVRHPNRIRRVVLDSPFPLVYFDPWWPNIARAVPMVATRVCRRSASCRRDQHHPARKLAWLAKRLRTAPVDGTAFDSLGDPHTVHLDEPTLIQMLRDDKGGGFTAQSEVAAAAQALRRGDPAPLLRLAAETLVTFPPDPPEIYSAGLQTARFCTDQRFQWDPAATHDERMRQFEAARDALDPRRFAPFSLDGWVAPAPLGASLPDPCIGWPAPTHVRERPVPDGASVPSVPALVLAGEYDLLLPRATVRHVRKVFPRSRLIDIAASGHGTAGYSDCARTLIQRFLLTGDAGDASCAQQPFAFPGVGRFPRTSADARPAVRASGEDRSTRADRQLASAAAATVVDAFRRGFIAGPTDHGRSLRGGVANTGFDDAGPFVDLALAHFVDDLGVTGHGRYDFGTSTIDANVALVVPGSFGQVQISGVWLGPGATTLTIDGQIGGRRIIVKVPAT